jgi:hypothetical protein
MAARTTLALGIVTLAAALGGCGTESLRVPPSSDASGAAGGAGTSPYATGPTGGGLVTGGGAISGGIGGRGGPGGPSGGTGSGGGGGAPSPSGMGAIGGTALMGSGGTGGATMPTRFPGPPWTFEGRGKYVTIKFPPIAMSQNGTRVLDRSGAVWSDEGGPAVIVTPTTVMTPVTLSGDGTTVAGNFGPAPCPGPATLSFQTGLLSWPVMARVVATSTDGGVTVATSSPPCMPMARAMILALGDFVLGRKSGFPFPPLMGDDTTEALAVSPDGSTAIAFSSLSTQPGGRLASSRLFTPAAAQDVKMNHPRFGVFTSADGSMVAGTTTDAAGSDVAFAWAAPIVVAQMTAPLRVLPNPPMRGQSLVFGLSADGSTVVALGTNAPSGPPNAGAQDGLPFTVRSDGSGLQMLQIPPPVLDLESVLMTPDASLIVGNPTPNQGMPAVVWDVNRNPTFLFSDAPMFRGTCHPFIMFVSADGKTFSGACDLGGRNLGFIARF